MWRRNSVGSAASAFVFLLLLRISAPGMPARILAIGTRLSGVCGKSEPVVFQLNLQRGTAARIELDQTSADLAIKVISPDQLARVVDSFSFGVEGVTVLASSPGIYRLEISTVSKEEPQARFSVLLKSIGHIDLTNSQNEVAEDLATESRSLAADASSWEKAMELTRRSLIAWENLGNASAVALTHLKIGDLFFGRGLWEQARSEYSQAQELCAGNPRCLAEAANNAGLSSINLLDYDHAEVALRLALDTWRQLRMPLMEGITHSNLGILYRRVNEWQMALMEYDIARRLFDGRRPLSLAQTMNNIGIIYYSLSDWEKAADYFARALEIASRQPNSESVVGHIRISLGASRMYRGSLVQAARDESAALALMEKRSDLSGMADARSNLGQVEFRQRNLGQARQDLNEALNLSRQINDPRGTAAALHYLGLIAGATGQPETARDLLRQSLTIRKDRRLMDEASETLYQMALLQKSSGHASESVSLIQEAVETAEQLRLRMAAEPLRRSYFAGKQKLWEFYVSALLAGESPLDRDRRAAQAFEVHERGLARSLVDLSGETKFRLDAALKEADPDLAARWRSIRRRLNALSSRLAGLPDTPSRAPEIATVRQQIATLLEQDTELESVIESKSPAYSRSVSPPVSSVAEVREILRDGDLLVEYFIGDERSYVWKMNRNGINVSELPPRNRIDLLALRLIDLLGRVEERKADSRKQAELEYLSRELAATLHLSFTEGALPKRLFIVPDGILHRVPFAVLRTGSARGKYVGAGQPLGLNCELLQAPSASMLRIFEERGWKAAGQPVSVAAFVDPVFDSWDSRVRGGRRSRVGDRPAAGLPLARVPFASVETEPLKRMTSQRHLVLRGLDSTKAALFSTRVQDFPILFLSTHAYADDLQPELSSIAMTAVDGNGRPVDGLVRLYEILGHHWNAFVVLSGCETAAGKEMRGEGLIGLSYGFLEAGATGLLASSAKIDAEASAFLMSEFLGALLKADGSVAPAEALLDARRAVARSVRWKDPYYWGSFFLISGA